MSLFCVLWVGRVSSFNASLSLFLALELDCDSGFDKLHPDFIIHLKKNLTALRTFVLGHAVPLTWYSPGLVDGQQVKTAAGNRVTIRVAENGQQRKKEEREKESQVDCAN